MGFIFMEPLLKFKFVSLTDRKPLQGQIRFTSNILLTRHTVQQLNTQGVFTYEATHPFSIS